MAHKETIFGLESTQLKFGRNSLNELGWELSKYNSKKILLVVDPVLQDFDITQKILDQIKWNEDLIDRSVKSICDYMNENNVDYAWMRFSINKYILE